MFLQLVLDGSLCVGGCLKSQEEDANLVEHLNIVFLFVLEGTEKEDDDQVVLICQ